MKITEAMRIVDDAEMAMPVLVMADESEPTTMAAVKTGTFIPRNPIYAALDMSTNRPRMHIIDRAGSNDAMLTFESRAAIKALSDALLSALQDHEVTSREK